MRHHLRWCVLNEKGYCCCCWLLQLIIAPGDIITIRMVRVCTSWLSCLSSVVLSFCVLSVGKEGWYCLVKRI